MYVESKGFDFLKILLVSVRNIKRIHNRFSRLDRNEKGFVSPQDFGALPEVNKSNLTNRISETLATKDKKQIDFSKFIKTLSNFHYDNTTEKFQFLFEIYDIDKDGYVGNKDLFSTMKVMIGQDLSDSQIQNIVDKTIQDMDEDKDGKLSFSEFSKALQTSLPTTDI